MARQIIVKSVTYPVKGQFRIARSSVSEVHVVTVDITHNGAIGRAECRPYARYGDTVESVIAQIEAVRASIHADKPLEILHAEIQTLMPAGPARNAVDCALWDLRAKLANKPVWALAGIAKPVARTTAFTLSVDTSENMAKAAKKAHKYPLLKLKIKSASGLAGCRAVMKARPDAQLIIDANESVAPKDLSALQSQLSAAPVLCIEQPIPAGQDKALSIDPEGLPILCADESMHTRAELNALWDAGYRAVNIKLDKTGGFSEALAALKQAKSMGFLIMAGCMVGSSLAMAPMMVLSTFADFIDLDGPLLLRQDIKDGLVYHGPTLYPPSPSLWG